MRRLGGIGWIAFVLAVLAVAAAADLVELPRPPASLVIERATLLVEGRPATEVSLPHIVYARDDHPSAIRYRVEVDAARSAALYVPLINRPVTVEVDGETIYDSADDVVWAGPAVTTPFFVRLPPPRRPGEAYRLTFTVEPGPFAAPTYVSEFYVGGADELSPAFKWRKLVDVDLRTVALAAQTLLAAGILLAWLLRPRNALLSWLAVLLTLTVIVTPGMYLGFLPVFWKVYPYVLALAPAYALAAVAVSLQLLDVRPPRTLVIGILPVTAIMLGLAVIGTPLALGIVAGTAASTFCVSAFAACGIIAWGALWRGDPDARIMLVAAALISWCLLRDVYVVATLPHQPFRLHSPHAGLPYVLSLCAVLARRMANSFDRLDRSNEVLNARLAEREAELAALSRLEKIEAARLVREQERARLTRDLHDGISGHLVSIIALSEQSATRQIEQAARDALNDLRLVIYSLDIGERELTLALANFRERLEPQLHRLGVALDWSMANLPEVSGVTPGNALVVLRILQEAITNALKHGPAQRIAVRGGTGGDGRAAIIVDNDGHPFAAESRGRGLDNMHLRAARLNAFLTIEPRESGARVLLLLPRQLPDLEV